MARKNILNDDDDSTHIDSIDSNEDIDNLTVDDITSQARENFKKNELYDRIVKYLKIDNIIRDLRKQLREKVKTLNQQKEDMEKFILRYLNDQEEDQITISGDGKLTKCVSKRKGVIKPDNIKQSVIYSLKKDKIITDETVINDFVINVFDMIEKNRTHTEKTYLKRTFEKKSGFDRIKQQIANNDDDDLPKYKGKK